MNFHWFRSDADTERLWIFGNGVNIDAYLGKASGEIYIGPSLDHRIWSEHWTPEDDTPERREECKRKIEELISNAWVAPPDQGVITQDIRPPRSDIDGIVQDKNLEHMRIEVSGVEWEESHPGRSVKTAIVNGNRLRRYYYNVIPYERLGYYWNADYMSGYSDTPELAEQCVLAYLVAHKKADQVASAASHTDNTGRALPVEPLLAWIDDEMDTADHEMNVALLPPGNDAEHDMHCCVYGILQRLKAKIEEGM